MDRETSIQQRYLGRKGLVIFLAALTAFPALSTDLYLPALPDITVYFDVPEYQTNLTLLLFFIVYAVSMVVWGPFSDRYGRRPILLVGLTCYTLAGLLCAVSANVFQLMFFRVLQALGTGAASATATAIVKDVYHGRKREVILAVIQTMTVLSPAVAPVIGAAILSFTSWRGAFVAQGILGVLVLAGSVVYQETVGQKLVGNPLASLRRLGVVAKNRTFLILILTFSLVGLAQMAFISGSSYVYQVTFGVSSQMFSFFFAIFAVSAAAGAQFYVLVSRRYARNTIITWSFILSLVSAVANGYITLRDFDKQREIAVNTAKTREESYKLFKQRFEGGVISELELNQVKSEYEQALATIPQIEKQIVFQENALSRLLGRNPGPIARGKHIDELVLPAVPMGLPSDLLANRPDIRQAEQVLVAANARIGVARAQYFPALSLTGLFGQASADLSNLFTGSARVWSWGGSVAAPIFTGGAIRGQVKAAEAVRQQALFGYQRAIQTAFREVEDALVDQRRTREQLEAQQRQVDSLRDYTRFARLRYENGYTSYIEVLDAERSLFSAELTYVQTQGTLFGALVNLYKAMGGGWVVEADKLTVSSSKKEQ